MYFLGCLWKPLINFTRCFYFEVRALLPFLLPPQEALTWRLKSNACKMEQNIFYLQTKFILDTVIKTAADVIGPARERCAAGAPNVGREVRFAPVLLLFSAPFSGPSPQEWTTRTTIDQNCCRRGRRGGEPGCVSSQRWRPVPKTGEYRCCRQQLQAAPGF